MGKTNEKGLCRCTRADRAFDARQAYDRLAHKYVQLAELVAQYMSEAPMERGARNQSARKLALRLQRIVGGQPVESGGFPDCCLVGERFGDRMSWFCTGVLIHPQVVISAAHCLEYQSNYYVALNTNTMNSLDDSEVISAKRVVVHPDYAATGLHDLAVMVLRRPSSVSPTAPASSSEVRQAKRTQLVGFGNSDVQSTSGFGKKRRVEVPITAIRRCPSDDLSDEEDRLGFESDLEFVAGGDGFDSCNGDSGGPAYIAVDGKLKVAGLTSRATDIASNPCGDGGIYTRVDVHLEFIREVMNAAGLSDIDQGDPLGCGS